MSEQIDRPATLKRAPKPAADNDVDPVDLSPAPAAKPARTPARTPERAAMPRRAAPRREPTIPLSTRVSTTVAEILDAAVAANGISQRAAIETAIREYWGRR